MFIDIHIHSLLLSSSTQDEATGIPNCWSWGGPSIQDPASVPNSATTVAIRPVVLGRTNDIDWNHQLPTDNCWCQLYFFDSSPHLMAMKNGKRIMAILATKFWNKPKCFFSLRFWGLPKIAHPFTGIRIQAILEDLSGLVSGENFVGWKKKQIEFRSAQKQNKRIEMKWFPPMPTQWLPLESMLTSAGQPS